MSGVQSYHSNQEPKAVRSDLVAMVHTIFLSDIAGIIAMYFIAVSRLLR